MYPGCHRALYLVALETLFPKCTTGPLILGLGASLQMLRENIFSLMGKQGLSRSNGLQCVFLTCSQDGILQQC